MEKRMVILLDIEMLLDRTHTLDPETMEKAMNAINEGEQ